MEDRQIVELYWQRDERAISETDEKYGTLCMSLAVNLLSDRRDAEECVSDVYRAAWDSMPVQRPKLLRPWLARVTRNISISMFRKLRAKKRVAGIDLMLDELDECIPSRADTER